MQIVIDIPKEFETHFNSDKFEDSLQRIRFDIHKAFIGNEVTLSGNYEIETLDMLTEAFLNGTPLPKGHGRLIDADKIIEEATEHMKYPANHEYMECVIAHMNLAPTIIDADTESEVEE